MKPDLASASLVGPGNPDGLIEGELPWASRGSLLPTLKMVKPGDKIQMYGYWVTDWGHPSIFSSKTEIHDVTSFRIL